MPEPIKLSLESSSGGTFSFPDNTGMPTVVVYESLQNQSLNAWFRDAAKTWVQGHPTKAQPIRLMIVVDAPGAPTMMRDAIRATVRGMIAPTGIKEVFFDWDKRFRVAMGLQATSTDPIYALLDRQNCASWGRFGRLDRSHWEELLEKIDSQIASA